MWLSFYVDHRKIYLDYYSVMISHRVSVYNTGCIEMEWEL